MKAGCWARCWRMSALFVCWCISKFFNPQRVKHGSWAASPSLPPVTKCRATTKALSVLRVQASSDMKENYNLQTHVPGVRLGLRYQYKQQGRGRVTRWLAIGLKLDSREKELTRHRRRDSGANTVKISYRPQRCRRCSSPLATTVAWMEERNYGR